VIELNTPVKYGRRATETRTVDVYLTPCQGPGCCRETEGHVADGWIQLQLDVAREGRHYLEFCSWEHVATWAAAQATDREA